MAPSLLRVAGAAGTKPQGFVQGRHNCRVGASETINSTFFFFLNFYFNGQIILTSARMMSESKPNPVHNVSKPLRTMQGLKS